MCGFLQVRPRSTMLQKHAALAAIALQICHAVGLRSTRCPTAGHSAAHAVPSPSFLQPAASPKLCLFLVPAGPAQLAVHLPPALWIIPDKSHLCTAYCTKVLFPAKLLFLFVKADPAQEAVHLPLPARLPHVGYLPGRAADRAGLSNLSLVVLH